MKKGIVTVFIILGILVLGVIIWGLVFNKGLLNNGLNAIIKPINDIFTNMTGGSEALIHESGVTSGVNVQDQNNLNKATSQAWGKP